MRRGGEGGIAHFYFVNTNFLGSGILLVVILLYLLYEKQLPDKIGMVVFDDVMWNRPRAARDNLSARPESNQRLRDGPNSPTYSPNNPYLEAYKFNPHPIPKKILCI